jgi:uncharacterized membrane protein YozB (DUF420 family)
MLPTFVVLAAAHPLVHVNASLNTLATLLLILGFVLIKQRKEAAHKVVMLSAFVVSVVFLGCYLYYHLALQLQTPFGGTGISRQIYFTILISHILLAITVPPLAITTIVLGLRAHGDWLPASIKHASSGEQAEYTRAYRQRHLRWARVTFPIWLYVSVTGVIVYLMLYHWFPAAVAA